MWKMEREGKGDVERKAKQIVEIMEAYHSARHAFAGHKGQTNVTQANIRRLKAEIKARRGKISEYEEENLKEQLKREEKRHARHLRGMEEAMREMEECVRRIMELCGIDYNGRREREEKGGEENA